ncbi:unnamed protein product [Clonostachys rhizophaga]|uniref:MARVEL domain-containing protein n=1 Tax=Clonostachys rhizophaga TaxID=160324 RepID=A0A9N9V7D9_9HYPO|nr:unnamed protein product [Clonostachys rhizophaga]
MQTWEWEPSYVPPVKLGLHVAQLVISFVIWCLEIAVFRGEDAQIVGLNGWTFGVCFMSIPAWVYLIMTPRFDRTRHLANANAMLALDVAFVIIWLSAFSTQASYNAKELCGKACNLSAAIVGLGVVETVFWIATVIVSGFTWNYFKFHGSLPGYDNRKLGGESIDPDKAAFSMAPHDDDAYERVNMDDHEANAGGYGDYNQSTVSSNNINNHYASNPYSADDFDDSNHYGSVPPRNTAGMFDSNTEYNSSDYNSGPVTGAPVPQPYGSRPTAYDEPAQFPAGNYDRVER